MSRLFKINPRYLVYFIPGLVILALGMMALHAYMTLLADHQQLQEYYTHLHSNYELMLGRDDVFKHASPEVFLKDFQMHQQWLYWSILGIGLVAFVLLVLNADKFRKLAELQAERAHTIQLLNRRLAAIEASVDGIGIVDQEGCLTYMNRALCELHGIDFRERDSYIGRHWFNLYTEKGREALEQEVMPAFEGHGYWRGKSPIVRQNGEIIIADLAMTRLKDGGFIGTARDVTEQEKAEKEKKDMQDQLYQAQKMEAIGRLAGGIAHDFNNILAAMRGYAEFLSEDLEEQPAQQVFADNILQAAKQAGQLVDKILAFSRREQGGVGPVSVLMPLEESIAMLNATLPKSIELKEELTHGPSVVQGNHTQIAQIIMNLCLNARDAMEDEKGVLKVSLEPVQSLKGLDPQFVKAGLPSAKKTPPVRIEDGSAEQTMIYINNLSKKYEYVRLRVEDNGTGMSREVTEHIFEPFFTTKSVEKGTGLGLSTVHGLIAAHQGAIIVDTKIGKGTCFDVFFPLSKENVAETEVAVIEDVVKAEAGLILLVEDQEDVREMTSIMLGRLGFEYLIATNGMEGLDIIRERYKDISLVLTDQNMPKMSGVELMKETHVDFPDIPFVILSGYSKERLQDLMEAHPSIKAIVRKPIAKENLGQVLVDVLAKEQKKKVA